MGTPGVKNPNFDQKLPKVLILCENPPSLCHLITHSKDKNAFRFNLNVFFGYFVLSNDPNWEDFCIISIFRVIFGQNLGF